MSQNDPSVHPCGGWDTYPLPCPIFGPILVPNLANLEGILIQMWRPFLIQIPNVNSILKAQIMIGMDLMLIMLKRESLHLPYDSPIWWTGSWRRSPGLYNTAGIAPWRVWDLPPSGRQGTIPTGTPPDVPEHRTDRRGCYCRPW